MNFKKKKKEKRLNIHLTGCEPEVKKAWGKLRYIKRTYGISPTRFLFLVISRAAVDVEFFLQTWKGARGEK